MTRQAFFSFHYDRDCQRAAQVRNIGVAEGDKPVCDNDWEEVRKKDDASISKWIDDQMKMRSCVIVLIGTETAGRKWIKYEIENAWNNNKGIVGIHIHNLKDLQSVQSPKGQNPFDDFTLGETPLSVIAKAYDPPYTDSKDVYNYIAENLDKWAEESISLRGKYSDTDKITQTKGQGSKGTITNPHKPWYC